MRNPTHLLAHGVTKRFAGPHQPAALDGASVSVPEHESLALLGPSGCGKTTLLRVLAGLETPDAGRVELAGTVLTDVAGRTRRTVPAERRRIGMVFQDAALFPHLDVAHNVAYGLTRAEVAAGRVAETLELVDLTGLGHRRPHELSGGQAQRVALARALAPRPQVLLFDEAFNGLDANLRTRVRADVVELLREVGMTSVFVTHDQEEAFVVGDRVAVMREGRVVQHGTPAEVYARPVDPWVAAFVGEANLLPATVTRGLAATAVGPVPVATATGTSTPGTGTGTGRVLVRPEDVHLVPGGAGVVRGVDFYGHDSGYRVDVAGQQVLVRAPAAPTHAVGDRVDLRFAGREAQLWLDARP